MITDFSYYIFFQVLLQFFNLNQVTTTTKPQNAKNEVICYSKLANVLVLWKKDNIPMKSEWLCRKQSLQLFAEYTALKK